jgi:hypothetical protein
MIPKYKYKWRMAITPDWYGARKTHKDTDNFLVTVAES